MIHELAPQCLMKSALQIPNEVVAADLARCCKAAGRGTWQDFAIETLPVPSPSTSVVEEYGVCGFVTRKCASVRAERVVEEHALHDARRLSFCALFQGSPHLGAPRYQDEWPDEAQALHAAVHTSVPATK